MSMRALTATDVARELGRSPDWLFSNWPRLVKEKRIPAPLLEAGGLTWSAAQFYAVIDKRLTADQRAAAAAYRAALEAAKSAAADLEQTDAVLAARDRLDQRFHREGAK